MADLIVILIIAAALAAAVIYIIRAKKSGAKCIGCSAANSCGSAGKNACGCSCGCGSIDEIASEIKSGCHSDKKH